jgi:hypothetical protein
MNTSEFRKNVYNLIDRVIEKGEPLLIDRKGHVVKVLCEPPKKKLDSLSPHSCIVGDSESLVEIDWSKEWNRDPP